jgi:hypothetical protein
MNRYLLIEGSDIYDFPVVLFISNGERIDVYSDDDRAVSTYTKYVDDDKVMSLEALADRFPYCESEIGEVDSEIEKIRSNLAR